MAVDIESIFKATAQSSRSFLITNGQGCYIPAYQRPYSWGAVNINRLFEDALHGLNLLKKRENTVSFLGTVIAIHDTKHVTVQPIYKSEMPSKVMTIIDGQQRISTFLMINIAVHNFAKTLLAKVAKARGDHIGWIEEQLETLCADLQDTFLIDMKIGDENYKFYPRLIRSYDDVWSKRRGQAKYESPICRLIWEYHLHANSDNSLKAFRFSPKTEDGETITQFSAASLAFKNIYKQIAEITGKKHSDFDFPDVLDVAQTKQFATAIWGYEVEDSVIQFLRDGHEDKDHLVFCQMFRLLILSKYLNDRMAFTVVTAENEDDAFDMFEALNTTGEPLTAFETFKPKVIEAEGVQNYEHSKSFEYVSNIEEYFEQFKGAQDKQKATSEVLIPFALAETGEKLQKTLVEQRGYLREQFDSKLTSLEEKQEFVRRLAHLSKFMHSIWKTSKDTGISINGVADLDDQTATGLLAIRDLNHHIVVAPLSRFYCAYMDAEEGDLKRAAELELTQAMRATVAFSIIWRSAFGGASGIDSNYRKILSDKLDGKYGPLAERPKEGVGNISLANYKKSLLYFLSEEKLDTREAWVKRVSREAIYGQKNVARFLLFLASQDAAVDQDNPGLIVAGRPGLLEMLSPKQWSNKDYLTVEHIAPQSRREGWDEAIYEEPENVDLLGNLTLLPAIENSMVGNKEWRHKRALYKVLSTVDEAELQKAKDECKDVGLSLSHKSEEILNQASYLPLCKSLSQKETDWDMDFIRLRSKRIAELAWDRLFAWLD